MVQAADPILCFQYSPAASGDVYCCSSVFQGALNVRKRKEKEKWWTQRSQHLGHFNSPKHLCYQTDNASCSDFESEVSCYIQSQVGEGCCLQGALSLFLSFLPHQPALAASLWVSLGIMALIQLEFLHQVRAGAGMRRKKNQTFLSWIQFIYDHTKTDSQEAMGVPLWQIHMQSPKFSVTWNFTWGYQLMLHSPLGAASDSCCLGRKFALGVAEQLAGKLTLQHRMYSVLFCEQGCTPAPLKPVQTWQSLPCFVLCNSWSIAEVYPKKQQLLSRNNLIASGWKGPFISFFCQIQSIEMLWELTETMKASEENNNNNKITWWEEILINLVRIGLEKTIAARGLTVCP